MSPFCIAKKIILCKAFICENVRTKAKRKEEVSTLLQLGERFSLPIYHDRDKRLAIHEFIKDVESDLALKKSNQ